MTTRSLDDDAVPIEVASLNVGHSPICLILSWSFAAELFLGNACAAASSTTDASLGVLPWLVTTVKLVFDDSMGAADGYSPLTLGPIDDIHEWTLKASYMQRAVTSSVVQCYSFVVKLLNQPIDNFDIVLKK